MTITAEQVYLLNRKMGRVASNVQLGTLIQNAEAVTAGEIAMANGTILVGNVSGVAAAVTMSGDVTVTNAGVAAIGAAKVTAGMHSLADGTIVVGNASNVGAAVTFTGDVTVTNAGVTAIGSSKVLKAMLAAGIVPSHVVKFAGKHTTAGGDATEVITVTGLLTTDVVHVTVQTTGTGTRTIVDAVLTADTITVTMSGDPSNNHILGYSVLRATT